MSNIYRITFTDMDDRKHETLVSGEHIYEALNDWDGNLEDADEVLSISFKRRQGENESFDWIHEGQVRHWCNEGKGFPYSLKDCAVEHSITPEDEISRYGCGKPGDEEETENAEG